MFRQFGNKYGVAPVGQRTYNGVVYASKAEAVYASELDLRVKAREIKGWVRQRKFVLDVNGKHICNYIIDFEVFFMNGEFEFIEVKGHETPEWKLKFKLFEALYPAEFKLTRVVK